MNVSQMLTGYAFGTIRDETKAPEKKPEPCSEARLKTLHAGRATKKANAEKRRAAMAEMIKAGSTVMDVVRRFDVCGETVMSDLSMLRGSAISDTLADAFAATAPTIRHLKFGHRKATLDKREKILKAIKAGPLDIYELADRFHMSRPCMYGYILRLEDDGLIKRTDERPYRLIAV